ncbi:MAG: hypothetical protein U1E62_18020 [Alsobacter sp.]
MDTDPRDKPLPRRRPAEWPSPASQPLRAARSCGLATRFHAWTGRSGRRYVVSVHGRRSLPEFSDAVLLAVSVDEAGGLTLIGVRASDDGLEDWPDLARADEVHVHLLARRPEERARVVTDLA